MKIKEITPFILNVPVTRNQISDSTHTIGFWGMPGVIIHTDSGINGYGYTGTHAHYETDKLITDCAVESYGPLLIGEDPIETLYLWDKINHFPATQWVGRTGILSLAQSVIDIALWDIKAKAYNVPLWKLLGGNEKKKIVAYNTDCGWLNWSLDQLVSDMKRIVEEDGFLGVKMKVGSPLINTDLERLNHVRKAIHPSINLMVDANGRLDLPSAIRLGVHLSDFDVKFFEEPIWYDDVEGHSILARSINTPIALGEQLYLPDDFKNFIRAQAVNYVQADAVRLPGITSWWQVADYALLNHLPVVAHIGDMMQVHLQLEIAHHACHELEYIPWVRECFEEPATVRDGYFAIPELPGAGTTIKTSAMEEFNVLK